MILNQIEMTNIILYPNDIGDLLSISKNQLCNILKNEGIVLFRGYNADSSVFSQLIKKTTNRVTIDPARKNTTQNTQLVDAGNEALGLHVENGNTPFLPHAIWFFCEMAAQVGSETTFCDGRVVWEKLNLNVKNIFLEKKIKFQRKVEEKLWKKYVSAEQNIPLSEINNSHLQKIQHQIPGLNIKLNDDQSIQMSYITAAAHPTYFSSQLAFANSLLGPSYNYEVPRITFADDSEIPNYIWEEIKNVTDANTHNIFWENKDIVVIDNTRVMHGRRKILDPARIIYAAMSYWD